MHFLFLFSLLVNEINNRLVEYKELALCIADSRRCFTALDSKHKSGADDVFISVLMCHFWHGRKGTCFCPNNSKWPEGLKRILIKRLVILSLGGMQKNGYASKTFNM